jgi:hypothetical protein
VQQNCRSRGAAAPARVAEPARGAEPARRRRGRIDIVVAIGGATDIVVASDPAEPVRADARNAPVNTR